MTGLDTETHKGKAILIASPRAFCEPWQWRTEDRFLGIVDWLSRQDRKEGFVCWNSDYDIQALLKWLPRGIGDRLHWFTRADYQDLRIRFVPGKFFTVHRGSRRLVAIYDLMQFYACSLERAAAKYLNQHKTDPGIPWDAIKIVLESSYASLRLQLIDYCQHDAYLVEELYKLSKLAMSRIGVKFNRPVSCASISSQKFKDFRHEIPREVNRAFYKTFRGGRMECLKLGFFPKAYLYDIHSAYPSVIANLPTLPTVWSRISRKLSPDAVFAAVKVTLRIPHTEYVAPVPTKGETQLIYPTGSWPAWLDLETFRSLEARGWIDRVLGGIEGLFSDRQCPFRSIEKMYQERRQTPENSWALKIVMNAWYGKLAQRITRWKPTRTTAGDTEFWGGECFRKEEQWTKRTCFPYAAAITAGIRRRMLAEIPPEKVIFYATDGIATTEKLDLQEGPNLGEWGSECITDLLVVGSGVYCYRDSKNEVRTKFRGFDVGLDLYTLLDCRSRVVSLEVKRNVTLAHALIQHRWKELNEIQQVPRYLEINFDKKRRWERDRCGRDLLKRVFSSEPWRYYGEVEYSVL
jgi:hypothetical protein